MNRKVMRVVSNMVYDCIDQLNELIKKWINQGEANNFPHKLKNYENKRNH
jgi:hypothetical protein